jgi:iron complex transport system substrate-binding protein
MRLIGLLVLLVVAGCGGDVPPPPAGGPAARIVSLAPSVTETLYALGAGDRLVGVCAQCDYPAAVAKVPRVGGYMVPSVEEVIAARPDLVIVVPSPGNHDPVLALERLGLRVLVVHDRTLDDLWTTIGAIADAVGLPGAGERLVRDLRARLDAVAARVAGLPRRRVLLVVGHDPLIVVGRGTLQDELITLAGGTNVAADAGTAWPKVAFELVVARAPEVILDTAMGTEAGATALFAGLTSVPAVRDGRVVTVRDDALLRAGPRVPEAAARLAAVVHPEAR